jgi:hypothetical protein
MTLKIEEFLKKNGDDSEFYEHSGPDFNLYEEE